MDFLHKCHATSFFLLVILKGNTAIYLGKIKNNAQIKKLMPLFRLKGRPCASPDAVADTVELGKQQTWLRMRLQPATHKDAPLA